VSRAAGLLRRAVGRLLPTPRQPPPGTPQRGHGVVVGYQPQADGKADPGEVVWAWVPYEEDASQGKDRPVLVVGRDGDFLVCLMLTSKDHDARRARDAAHGRLWMDVGAGGWDRQGRPSEVRLDRVLYLDPRTIRREGAALNKGRFRTVANAARKLHHWA
jgi:hypothetical protein